MIIIVTIDATRIPDVCGESASSVNYSFLSLKITFWRDYATTFNKQTKEHVNQFNRARQHPDKNGKLCFLMCIKTPSNL